MKCHYCGTEITQRDIFCCNCGTRQEPVREEAPAEQVSAAAEEYAFKPEMDRVRAYDLPPLPDFLMEMTGRNGQEPENPRAGCLPRLRLPTDRSLAKMVLLGILTLGIYPMVIFSRIVTELNIAASRYDGERTMPYFAMVLLTPLTLFIYMLVWFHDFSRRIGAELRRRRLVYQFGARDFWLWNILGSLILVGPFVYMNKLMKSMNLINRDFNIHG